MLKWRLLLGTTIVLVLAALCWLDAQADLDGGQQMAYLGLPGFALMPVLLVLVVLATQEVLRFARSAGLRPAAAVIYVGNLLIVLGQWLPYANLYLLHHYVPGREFDYLGHADFIHAASQSALWALALGVLLIFVAEMQRFETPGGALANIAVGVLCLVYVGLMFSFAVQIRTFWGVGALAAWIITVKMGDIGAYTVGRLVGVTKMSPTISPGKTVEGAMGAILFACAGAFVSFHGITRMPWLHWTKFHWIFLPHFTWTSIPSVIQLLPSSLGMSPGVPLGWLLFGVAMAVTGILGDLAESLLKRDVGCKDSSSWLPGFGGVLDIIDSLLLSAPVAWLCWSLHIVGGGGGM